MRAETPMQVSAVIQFVAKRWRGAGCLSVESGHSVAIAAVAAF
jgi:hypothetical protein